MQLQQFGAEVYTINLIGRITVRELGPLMTAIMVAGRSGSAFAAQIGTMKITEEVDAMRTIGVSPIEALVIPRMIAAIIVMPADHLIEPEAEFHRAALAAVELTLRKMADGGIYEWAPAPASGLATTGNPTSATKRRALAALSIHELALLFGVGALSMLVTRVIGTKTRRRPGTSTTIVVWAARAISTSP